MPEPTIADRLERLIDAKEDIDIAITEKGGTVTKGLENSDDDIDTIPSPSVLIDKTITENGTYLPEDEYEVITLTNQTSPVELEDCNGDDAELSVKGNTVQNGTPTPQNPIQPNGTGELTENLFDDHNIITIPDLGDRYGVVLPEGTYSIYNGTDNIVYDGINDFQNRHIACEAHSTATVTLYTDPNKTCGFFMPLNAASQGGVTIVSGSTPPSRYIPHGYKLDIESGNITTPVYLGQVETTRQIKKLVLTGQENWQGDSVSHYIQTVTDYLKTDGITCCCSHVTGSANVRVGDSIPNNSVTFLLDNVYALYIKLDYEMTAAAFKAWLVAQYSAGTPVTIWYVLVNSTTGIVNEPLMKIGDYVDTLTDVSIPTTEGDNTITVDTTVPPSSIDVSYNKSLGADGYSSVTANVPTGVDPAPINQIVEAVNGSLDDSLNGSETVSKFTTKHITENGTYIATDDNALGYSSVTVDVASGGGSDVIFYDYDGTIVQSYSAADFVNLTAMPENPTHTGLTAQGWNWSLADAKTYVAAYGKLNIGQMYITSDGKTRLYYVIPKDTLTLNLYLTLDSDTELDIDWGDGTEHTTWTSNDGDSSKSHTYANGGRYTVAITVVSGGFSYQSSGNNDYTLKKIEFGSDVTSIGANAFVYCYSLSSVTIPNSVTSIGNTAIQECYALTSITIPNSVTSIGDHAISDCYALTSVTIPSSVTSIGSEAFYNCCALTSVTIPSSVTSIVDTAFSYCQALRSITIPSSVTSIGDYAFNGCYPLSSITIPNSVTSIGDHALSDCHALASITFEPTTPPELGSDLQLPTACIIRIPQGTLSAYTSATNYPDPSSYIYEEY